MSLRLRKPSAGARITDPVTKSPKKSLQAAAGPAFAQNITPPVSRGNGMATISSDVVKSLAPTGTLRAGINLGNIVLAQTAANGELAGVTVELGQRGLQNVRRRGAPGRYAETPPVAVQSCVWLRAGQGELSCVTRTARGGVIREQKLNALGNLGRGHPRGIQLATATW